MCSHDYMPCTSSFRESCKIDIAYHVLCLYTAGVAQVELYRLAKLHGDTRKAEEHAAEATNLLQKARDKAGRRKPFHRQQYPNIFVLHKLNKWEP